MRKIIPLIILIVLSALFTKAQNINQADEKLALYAIDVNKDAIGITADQLSNAKIATTYQDVRTGIRYVGLQQTYKGIPVYNQVLVLSFRNDKLLSKAGFFDPSIEKMVNVKSGAPSVSAESAVQSALSDRGFRASQMAIAIDRKDDGRFIEFGNMGISRENITAQLSWVPNELTKVYSLAWQVYIIPKTTSDYWMVRVDAVNNSILGMDNYTDYDNWGTPEFNPDVVRYPEFLYGSKKSMEIEKVLFDFKKADDPTLVTTATYRVIPMPAEAPSFPGGAPALRTDPWLAATANAVTLKWHTGAAAADYDHSRSNNVWSYEDRTAPTNTGTIAKSAASQTAFPNLTFDYVPNFTVDPTQNTPVPNQRFNITNLFYWNNIIHDVLYAYGFTEAGRNFQDDNLGRGGAGNDHVNAEAQDASGTNNANFATPADGSSGRMQMFLWTGTPQIDGDADAGVITHELGHGVSNRSNAGGVGCLGNQEQGGEGWSDYLGLMLTQNWATATLNTGFNSPRGIGTYVLNQPPTGAGIRPQRYCTDFAVNNATYATLPSQVVPHGVGWVWCSALWEMTWEIINDVGTIDANIYNQTSTAGNVVALNLVMEGLRTQQCQPGFISARNAIMRADTTLYGAIHACAILRAFARRGMGIGAAEGSTNSITDQTVSFNGGGPSMLFTQSGAAGVPELQNIVYNHAITAACSPMVNFTLRDTIPLNANFVSATNGGTYNAGNRVVSWPVNVALNATQNYGLTLQVAAGSYFPPVTLINEPVPSTTISGFWTTASTTANVWVAHNVRSHSAPNSFFTPDAAIVSDQTIAQTASISLGATPPSLSFWHWYNTENTFDGCVLEISTNGGGSYTDIGAANITQNGYNGTISTTFSSPIAGRQAWTGNSGAFLETKVNLTPYANQANVKLRWRLASDVSLASTGWNVDDIVAQTIAVVNLRSSLFNAANVRVLFNDTVTVILPPAAVNPNVTINQAAAQADPTSTSPINFTAVFDQSVINFATGDVTLSGTAGATTAIVTGGPTTYNIAVSGMTSSGTVIATIAAGVCTNAALNPNNASTSTDNTVTYNFVTPPGCIQTFSYTGPAVAIPDNTPAGVNIPITVTGVGTISDLNFMFDAAPATTCDATPGNVNAAADHTFIGDLVFTLTSPSATSVIIVNRRGGTRENICTTLLDDDGAYPALSTVTSTSGQFLSGNFAPDNPLSAFDGQNANGVWTLNISDNALIDIGSMRRFSLVITGAAPTIPQRANDTVCAGATAGPYNFTSVPAGATFAWTNSNTAIGLGASGTGNIPAFTATNATTAPITGTITVTPTIGTCPGTPMVFNIRVLPVGNVNAVPNQVICRGLPTAPVTFTGTVPGTIFNWTNNNPSIGLAASGTGNIASFIALNTTLVPQVATITVTPVYSPNGPAAPVVTTLNFTGAVQNYVVPAGVTSVNIKAWGAQGNSSAASVAGGLGGYAEGNLAVTPGQTLFVNVGGGGAVSVNGGFNGGGAAGANAGCAGAQGGGGGGASDVRITANTLANRVIVGAGGGGAGGNRVAGCGRGAGGGGGAGYYGGGGGAGWPGVPGGQGPNPTGGTQSAGGAGGVTTFSPGPTNGLPGALGVGGAGGTELGSAQGGSATAESGGVGGGLIGADGQYNQVNNWCGQSGAGGSSYIGGVTSGLTTSGLRAGNGQVQISYIPVLGVTCAGTPRTFTITVNPNPDIVIIADPGTTICEGDPTLLTVVLGTSTPVGTLYTQGTGVPANGSPSQVFEPANAAFTSQAADDFTVPAGASWTVTQITTAGIGAGVPTSVNVFFYANSGSNLPGAAIASYNNVATFTQAGGNYTVTLPTALTLAPGTYWVSFQVNMSFATGGQWFWGNFGATNVGNEYAWQNPGGGFATPCTNWGYGSSGCAVGGGVNRNNYFSLIGTSVVGGGPLPGGYTFLWSPAAGLSSTTSNPVAASPMNTTLYTVNVTTGQGCTRSAQILITVNKRPTVTVHPVSRVNCGNTPATFTVTGTGTGLTYQWQESVNGCAGPWTNLADGGPYSGVTTATLTVNPVTTAMNGRGYRVVLSGVCAPINNANISNCALLTVNPLPNVAITPVGPVCGGVACSFGTMLSVGSAPPPVPGSVTVSSGTISVAVPDGDAVGTSTPLTVAGVPANATITNISVTMNMPHTYPHDMIIGLKGPSGQVLSLYKHNTNTTVFPPASIPTAGWFNAVVSKTASTVFSTVPDPYRYGITAPAGPYKADALNGVTSTGYTINDQTGFVTNALNFDALYTTAASMNNTWTLALCDGGAGDLGTLTSWSIKIDYTTPGTGGGPTLTYVWSPQTGLYTDAAACIPYTGTNTPVVYAAPTVLTVYTVTATDVATGCVNTSNVIVNYTPPPPTVTPNPVAMCLGDAAVKLKSSSSQTFTNTFNSGTVNVNIPDGPTIPPVPTTYPASTSNITVSGIPVGANITGVRARFNVTHAYVGDLVMALKAPNGNIFNLDAMLNRTNNPGANFTNTVISSGGGALLSTGTAPFTNTYAADAAGATFTAFGFTFPGGPVGYVPNVATYNALYNTGSVNGVWSIGIYDAGAPDGGTLNNWSLDIDYVVGVPATPAVWSPAAGLFSDANALNAYVAGTAVDSVWARPTPAGVYTYNVTVQSLPVQGMFTNPANIVINASGPGAPYPSVINVSGLPTSSVTVDSVRLTGVSHTWGNDIDILLQSPAGKNVVLMSDIGGTVAVPNATYTFKDGAPALNANAANPTGTYSPTNFDVATDNWPAPGPGVINQPTPTLSSFVGTDNVNGPWNLFVFDDVGGDAGNISGGFTIWFHVNVPACTSPARQVVVTVNQPTTITTQPVAQTICTDKVATFTVVAAGSGPFAYQWQVSTNNGNTWTNITNGGVYSGATTATLTITAPPTTMNGYFYRAVVNGAAPCAAATSNSVRLTVNPLPVIVIAANPTSLFPGMTTTITSTVSPNAASIYTWLRNGVAVPGASTGSLNVDIDGLGAYQLRVQDVNGCTNVSNIINITDSASAKCFIYPNPTSGVFQVRYHSVANNILPRTLTVYDAKGDRVFTQMYTIGRPYDRMDVDMRAYGKGLYWVEIGDRNGNRLTMCRVVIQ